MEVAICSRSDSSLRSRLFSCISSSTWLARSDCSTSFLRASSLLDWAWFRLVKYSLTFFTACTGCKASHCTG